MTSVTSVIQTRVTKRITEEYFESKGTLNEGVGLTIFWWGATLGLGGAQSQRPIPLSVPVPNLIIY